MSTPPRPAAPAAPAAAPAADAHAADNAASHSPAFAAALNAALAPRAPRTAAHADADAPVAAEAEDIAAAHDVVYHTHTAATSAARDSAPALPGTAAPGTDSEHAARTMAEGAAASRSREAGSLPRTPGHRGTSPADAIDAAAIAGIIPRNPGVDAARRSPDAAFRDAALLQPEFRARLDRVIARLEAMGHTVEVLETYRDQARQNHLYEQGRTRPGNVVTWTRTSNHTQGRAADLRIDGSFEPGVGYMRLAQVAAEEGLRTLGARDPGHVELPGGGRHAHAHPLTAPAGRHAPAVAVSAGGIAGVAGIAPLAAPAGMAGVAAIAAPAAVAAIAAPASLAAIAAPGAGAPAVAARGGGAPAVAGDPVAAATSAAAAADGEQAGPAIPVTAPARAGSAPLTAAAATLQAAPRARAADEGVDAIDDSPFGSDARTGGDAAAAAGGAHGSTSAGSAAARTEAVAHGADADIAGRIARVLQLQADAAAQPLTRVLLRLGDEGADGEMGRVRIDLRGATVTTAIDMADPVRAAELRGRIHELEAALQQRGLDTARLSVRSTANAAAASALAATIRPAGADAVPALPQLDALLTGQHDRSTDRQPEGGRQGAGRDPRQQQRQEAK